MINRTFWQYTQAKRLKRTGTRIPVKKIPGTRGSRDYPVKNWFRVATDRSSVSIYLFLSSINIVHIKNVILEHPYIEEGSMFFTPIFVLVGNRTHNQQHHTALSCVAKNNVVISLPFLWFAWLLPGCLCLRVICTTPSPRQVHAFYSVGNLTALCVDWMGLSVCRNFNARTRAGC